MNSVQRLKHIIEIGNTAKSCGAYEIASDIFVALLWSFKETGKHPGDMLVVETYCEHIAEWKDAWATDPHGRGYYDLPTIVIEDAMICIPLPHLSEQTIAYLTALPELPLWYREVHDCHHFNLNSERSEIAERDLRRRLNAYVSDDVLAQARLWGLEAYQPPLVDNPKPLPKICDIESVEIHEHEFISQDELAEMEKWLGKATLAML